MGLKISSAAAALIVLIIYYIFRRRQDACSSIKRHWTKDPLYGFDFGADIYVDVPALLRYHKKYGKSFYIWPLNSSPIVATIEPENIRAINSSGKDWGIQPLRLSGMSHFSGPGFLSTDGESWQKSRKMLKPIFSKNNMVDFSILSAEVDELFSRIPRDGQVIDLQPQFYDMFLNTSLYFLIGTHPSEKSAGAPCEPQQFIDAFHDAAFRTMLKIGLGKMWALIPKTKYYQSCEVVHRFLDFHIDQAIEKEFTHDGEKIPAKRSMLQGLVTQTSDRRYIRDHIVQGMMASLDTTSSLLGNAIFLLARHPHYWDEIRSEALKKGRDLLEFDALLDCKIVQNVLREALRLYPVFNVMERIAISDTTLPVGGGPSQTNPVFLEKGVHVVMNYFALHRDPSVFGEDVEAFRPERWESIHVEQWQFMAFGGGQRACLGQQKALVEAAYVLVRMAGHFERLESRDKEPWKGQINMTCKSANGCKVALFEA